MVIIGQLDSKMGAAVFYRLRLRLRHLRPGNRIAVTLADGAVAHFVGDGVGTYLNEDFPAMKVYGSRGFPALQLVTCAGTYGHLTHSYTANVVVYTTLVSTT